MNISAAQLFLIIHVLTFDKSLYLITFADFVIISSFSEVFLKHMIYVPFQTYPSLALSLDFLWLLI